jgi:hypothetical protein
MEGEIQDKIVLGNEILQQQQLLKKSETVLVQVRVRKVACTNIKEITKSVVGGKANSLIRLVQMRSCVKHKPIRRKYSMSPGERE